jgi:acetate kinase
VIAVTEPLPGLMHRLVINQGASMLKYTLFALVVFAAVPAEARPYQHPYFKWKKERQIRDEIRKRQAQEDRIQKNLQNAADSGRNVHCAAIKAIGGQC